MHKIIVLKIIVLKNAEKSGLKNNRVKKCHEKCVKNNRVKK